MKWTKYTLTTTTEAIDLVNSMLDEIGVEGIEIEDKVPLSKEDKERMFIDILPDLGEDDHIANISFYRDPEEDSESFLKQVRDGLEELKLFMDLGSCEIVVSETEDKDWINNWKEFFKPFRVDDDIVIKPTWEQLTEQKETDLVIEIDPGTAFGTGSHETTKLCIHGLKEYINEDTRLLDVGTGSGILSIIGLKLGAKSALGIDIDPSAIVATKENAEVNHIDMNQFKIMSGNIIDDKKVQEEVGMECYDIVVANILADIIIPLSAEIGQHLVPGGLFISSGIIDMKKEEVKAAVLANGFEIITINEMGDWVSIVAKKK